jgi:hypothetical protein
VRQAITLVPGDAHLFDQRISDGSRVARTHASEDGADVAAGFRLNAQGLPKLLGRDDAVADQHLADLVVAFATALVKRRRALH